MNLINKQVFIIFQIRSFNLGGEPLVETLDDAFRTLANSNIEYLYIAEHGILAKVEMLINGKEAKDLSEFDLAEDPMIVIDDLFAICY